LTGLQAKERSPTQELATRSTTTRRRLDARWEAGGSAGHHYHQRLTWHFIHYPQCLTWHSVVLPQPGGPKSSRLATGRAAAAREERRASPPAAAAEATPRRCSCGLEGRGTRHAARGTRLVCRLLGGAAWARVRKRPPCAPHTHTRTAIHSHGAPCRRGVRAVSVAGSGRGLAGGPQSCPGSATATHLHRGAHGAHGLGLPHQPRLQRRPEGRVGEPHALLKRRLI
jgi:hypothetical protein